MSKRYEVRDVDASELVIQGDSLRQILTAWSREREDRPQRNLQLLKDGRTIIIHHGTVVNRDHLTDEEIRLITNTDDTIVF